MYVGTDLERSVPSTKRKVVQLDPVHVLDHVCDLSVVRDKAERRLNVLCGLDAGCLELHTSMHGVPQILTTLNWLSCYQAEFENSFCGL